MNGGPGETVCSFFYQVEKAEDQKCLIKLKTPTLVNKKAVTISSSNQTTTKTSVGSGGGKSNRRYYKKRQQRRTPVVAEKKGTNLEIPSEGVPATEKLQKKGEGKRKHRKKRKKREMEKMGGGSEQNDDWLPLLQPESDAESADEMMMTTKTTTLDPLSWFQGLPGEDKSISLSISDKKFIGMILQTVDALSPNDGKFTLNHQQEQPGTILVIARKCVQRKIAYAV